eukprot:13091345-Alexandrium_andersonii.AAC.1
MPRGRPAPRWSCARCRPRGAPGRCQMGGRGTAARQRRPAAALALTGHGADRELPASLLGWPAHLAERHVA